MTYIFRKAICLLLAVLFFTPLCIGQESKLANEYYRSGEYEKAAVLYKKLHDKTHGSTFYFKYYIMSLIESDDITTAESELKKEIKQNPKNTELYVYYGDMLERTNKPEEANKEYRKAIENLAPDVSQITRLASAFTQNTKYDLSEETFLKGIDLLGNESIFSLQLADLYNRKDEKEKVIYYYLSSLNDNPGNLNNIKNYMSRNLKDEEDLAELKKQLYTKIQENPDIIEFTELLEWTFVQQKNYKMAFRQARSLDRKLEENGIRVYRLAALAEDDKDYDAAIDAYQYIVDDKGETSSYYVNASKAIMRCKRNKVMGDYLFTQEELDTLDNDYQNFLDRFGMNTNTASLVREYAQFLARNRNNVSKAITLLEEIKMISVMDAEERAFIKLDLGDYYLIDDNIWEATLLYSQVDKENKEGYVGELARFKNAQFSYYTGEFEWAQEQFNILKSATSRLISNDAIDLSVFIMDNLGLDTTAVPLQMYADAELLAFQNKNQKAFKQLDKVLELYPNHGLKDDILYVKANIHKKLQKYQKAVAEYKEIIEAFPEEIRCDNAIFELAELYEVQLDNKEKAMELYEKLFIDYSNSTFAIEARKRFRKLRGDDV